MQWYKVTQKLVDIEFNIGFPLFKLYKTESKFGNDYRDN